MVMETYYPSDFEDQDDFDSFLRRFIDQWHAGVPSSQYFDAAPPREYLESILGPLPAGAEEYRYSDLNDNGTNDLYAVDANGDPHTVYSYDDNNEVESTVYTDYLRDTIYGGVAPQTWEDVERILKAEGYDDEAIKEVRGSIKCLTKANEIKCDTEKFQGSVVLAGILNNSGYDGSWWDVRPTAGQPCQTDDGKQGEYDTNGGCTPNEYQEGDSCPTVPNGPKDGIIENGVCVGGDDDDSDTSCIVINQENADECGFVIDENGNLLDKGDRDPDEDSVAPFYTNCGGGIFAETKEDCPEMEGTGTGIGNCSTINAENADECGYEITSDGQLIPKDLSGAPGDYPNYDNCGNGVFVLEGTECPDVPITYSEEEQNTAEAIRDWVEGKIGEVKDMTVDDVLDVIFGGDAWDPQCKDEGDLSNCTGTDGTQGNKCWKDCVNISVLAGIPGLPMPPGAVDIGTVRDLENTANDIGTTIGNILNPDTTDESFIQQVKDWVTGKIDGIFGNVDDVTLEQITGWITGTLGSVLGSLILIETADATNTVTTKINEILGLPLTDPEDEKCIETEYFEANKEKCTALGYVDCDGALGEQGQELTGGIIGPNETTQGCSEIQNPDIDTTKCTEGSPDNDGNCICSDGTPEDEDGNCLDDTPLTPEQICEEKGLTYDPSDLNADPDGCVRVGPEVNPEQICEEKGLTYAPTAPEEDRDEDDCVSTVISDQRCNDPNAKNYNELGECGECESGFRKDPNTNECKPDGPTLDCTTITSENAAGCKKKDCGGGVFVDEGEDCPTTVNPCDNPQTDQEKRNCSWVACPDTGALHPPGTDLNTVCGEKRKCIDGKEPDPQKGCPEDWCDAAMTIAPDENGQCPSDPPLVKCPDGSMVANEKDCYKDTLIECPVKSDRPGTMVENIEDCYDSVTLIECPKGTPNEGQMVDDKSKCGTTTPYTCPDPNATTNEDGSCGPCKTGYAYDGAAERCVQSTTPDPCLSADYAAANPEQCGTGDCVDCTCAEYAAANPEECGTGGGGDGGGDGGGGGMFRPQAGVPPTLGDPQLLARMEFPIENFLQQYIDGPDNQDISITGLFEGLV